MVRKIYKVGIDVGSTTAKAVFIDQKGQIVFRAYKRHNTEIVKTLSVIFSEALDKFDDVNISLMITGSAGLGIAEKTDIPFIQEVVASAEVVKQKYPEVTTLIDLGGEDAKMIFFHKDKQPDIRMNGNCAGGTGAFIDQMATLLNSKVEELNEIAAGAEQLYPIASRCGVFAKTDIQNLISRKISKSDIAASVFHAVAVQSMNTLARGYDVAPKVMFSGGPFSFIKSLRYAFMKALKLNDTDVIVPLHPELIPAIGAAMADNTARMQTTLLDIEDLLMDKQKSVSTYSYRLDPLFSDNAEFESWKKEKAMNKVEQISFDKMRGDNCFMGIDSGSTTTKITVIDENEKLVFKFYDNNKGNPLDAVTRGLMEFRTLVAQSGKDIRVTQSAVTGYGEDLIKSALGIDYGIVETIAHFTAAKKFDPDVSFVLDIGGQDMKAIFISNGSIHNLEINEACSSGCGSFIEGFANTLNYNVADFARMACDAKEPCELGTRCTVFMNSKVKQSLREGAKVEDISAGLSYSVIKNCLFKVLKLKDMSVLGDHIVVQGGTFKNPSVHRALEVLTSKNVSCSDIPELMGAYGAALFALNKFRKKENVSAFIGFDYLESVHNYDTKIIRCKGCENTCAVTRFAFANGNSYFSGNKCEKIFINKGSAKEKGFNLYDYKYELLFNRKTEPAATPLFTIGIPCILNMYENFPFWNALFTECGIRVQLSDTSTTALYEKGLGSVMSDNICFPAKLAHGHIMDLIGKKVDRIFFPMVILEGKEQKNAVNSYNCPIVSSYSEVLKSSIDPLRKYGIPLDVPTIVFNDTFLLEKACMEYLKPMGVKKDVFKKAFHSALTAKNEFQLNLKNKALEITEKAHLNKRIIILLAGRPYHTDTLVQHKTAQILTDMGVDVINESVIFEESGSVFEEIHIVTQWGYPNRILKSAQWVAQQKNVDVHFVQLNSFGCGPDAYLIDEASETLRSKGKNHTLIKIDDISSTGSVRLRLRSLIESLRLKDKSQEAQVKRRKITRVYTAGDTKKTIIGPFFSEIYSPFLPGLFGILNFNYENIPLGDNLSASEGLKYANNEICYPATVIVGDIIKALKSGKYDINNTVVGITQTGGQCRATNYISLIKKAIAASGFENVPVISVASGEGLINSQPGFKIDWKKVMKTTFISILYADGLSKMYYTTVAKEKIKGASKALLEKYIEQAQPFVLKRNTRAIVNLLKSAVHEFNSIRIHDGYYPRVGIVGEIYVKYNSFGHLNIVNWLIEQGVEVVVPPLLDFMIQNFVNARVNKKENIERAGMSVYAYFLEKYANYHIKKIEKIMTGFRFHYPYSGIQHEAEKAGKVIDLANQFGEGWLIPGEISTFAEMGVNHVVSLQPFGCIANHVISKGVEKKIKTMFPHMNLLFLDFDSGTSEVNVHNRLYFMIKNAKEHAENNIPVDQPALINYSSLVEEQV
ncbi:MAG: 2-hydroxyacyl-CoA dehydratase [Bacteroidia bacterium]|nr:2-hydroxyacyl-CoA dehydratase [Bacteroidia bacterium]